MDNVSKDLPNLITQRPDQYKTYKHLYGGGEVLGFVVADQADYDWLEARILTDGYYERENIWALKIDLDKRILADIIASFSPRYFLEIGCATGAVISLLKHRGMNGVGLEISKLMIQESLKDARESIKECDLLYYEPEQKHDMVFAFDLIEHLNPNKIDIYLNKMNGLVSEDGFLLINVPVFGHDDIFGTVCEPYIEPWQQALGKKQRFPVLEVDAKGWPVHGHLTFADSSYWVSLFERHKFYRDVQVEKAIHKRFGIFFKEVAPARGSMYVFRKAAAAHRSEGIARSIANDYAPGLRRYRIKRAIKHTLSTLGLLEVVKRLRK